MKLFLIRFLSNLIAFLLMLLGPKRQKAIARGLSFLWFDVVRVRRYSMLKNVSIAFPEKSKLERIKIAKEGLYCFCLSMIDFCLLPKADFKNCRLVGRENYDKALEKGKGVLVLSLHLGSGDYGTGFLAKQGIRLAIISKTFKNMMLNEFWFGVRRRLGTVFIPAHSGETSFQILRELKNKKGVVFVADQFMGKPYGIETTFFGKKTGTAYGLALFAIKTGAPVIPIYTYRNKDDEVIVKIDGPLELTTDGERDQLIQINTQRVNDCLEQIIRVHPESWMWLHRRWKKWE